SVPSAYLIPGDLWRVIEMLRAHGLTAERMEESAEVDVQRFRIDRTQIAERPFEQHRQRSVEGEYERLEMHIPAGWYRFAMDQPLARLAFILLEPRSDDGFLNWNVFDPDIESATHYPVLRVPLDLTD
ncbi:MAG: peptidase M14, partial [Rhodothermales bacterium]